MSASNWFENQLMLHIFQNADIANIGDAAGLQNSVAAGNFWVSLHTADPGEAGTAITSETAYTGYLRVAVVRSAAGWTVASNVASNAAAINFPTCTAGTSTITHFGIVNSSTGAGDLLFSGAVGAPLAVSNGITPSYAIGQLTVTAD